MFRCLFIVLLFMASPVGAVTLELGGMALEPLAGTVPGRATWVSRSADWQQRGAELLDWAQRHQINQLFITIPLRGLKVVDPDALAAFVRRAHERGVAIASTDGDPHMVIPDEFAAAVNRVRAYEAYNRSVDKAARLDGIQFDVEPSLLPQYGSDPERWDWYYRQLAQALRAAAGPIRLEFVVPYWWANKAGVLRGLADHADGLTVLDYRTAPDDIYRVAVPFLDWADKYGKQVRVALEAGPVEADTERRYVRQIGPLERRFSARRGFAGIALHGLW